MSRAGDVHTHGHTLVHHAECHRRRRRISMVARDDKCAVIKTLSGGWSASSGKAMCCRYPHNDLTRGEHSRSCDKPGQLSCYPSRKMRSKREFTFPQPITNLILYHCQGRSCPNVPSNNRLHHPRTILHLRTLEEKHQVTRRTWST